MKFKDYIKEMTEMKFRDYIITESMSLKDINKRFVEYFKTLENTYYSKERDICRGFCKEWAWIVHRKTGAKLHTMKGFDHAFVQIGNKYYDSSTLKGVDDWRYLGGLKHVRSGVIKVTDNVPERADTLMTPGEFKKYWKQRLEMDVVGEISR